MNKLADKLAELINVKSIVTFIVTAVFAVLSLRGAIPSETVMQVVLMVLCFYFGTKYEQNNAAAQENVSLKKTKREDIK